MSTPAPLLLVEQTGATAWLTLNRPEKCNALSVGLNQALLDACRALSPEVAVVVLRGAGRHFCAGSDLRDLYQVSRAEAERVIQLEIDACHALAALPQLTVALLHGKCYGGGAILPLYCDLRVGLAGVEFSMPEVSLGWAPPYGLERIETLFRRSFGLDLLISGRVCGDVEALREGWIDRLMGADLTEAFAWIDSLAQRPKQVVRDLIAATAPKDLARMRHRDQEALAVFLQHFDTPHARQRIAAFFERKTTPPAAPAP